MKATQWRQIASSAIEAAFPLCSSSCDVLTPQTIKTDLVGSRSFAEIVAPFEPADKQVLTRKEFNKVATATLHDREQAVNLLLETFTFFDVDQDGSISPQDFRTAMSRLGEDVTWVEVRDVLSLGNWRSPAVGVSKTQWPKILSFGLTAQYKDNSDAVERSYSILGALAVANTIGAPEVNEQIEDDDLVHIDADIDTSDDVQTWDSELLKITSAKLAAYLIKANHRIPVSSARGEQYFTIRVFVGFSLVTCMSVIMSVLYPEKFGVFDSMLIVQSLILFLAELAWECVLSLVVLRYDVKINYTRKMGHLLRIPKYFLADYIPSFSTNPCTLIMAFLFSQSLFMLMFMRPVRVKSNFAAFCFLSQDRREDRPYTFRFQVTEDLMRYAIYLPFKVGFLDYLSSQAGKDLSPIVFVPIFINTVGDGLAEPVGVRFGRHKYRTRALYYNGAWCSGSFVRSLEGSAMVFLSSVAILCLQYELFTLAQFIVLMATLPLAMTLAEAFAPHTNDGPFLALVGCSLLAVVLIFIE